MIKSTFFKGFFLLVFSLPSSLFPPTNENEVQIIILLHRAWHEKTAWVYKLIMDFI